MVSRSQDERHPPGNEGGSRRLNQDVPTIFNCIEGAHALDERCRWHPNPTSTRRVHVQNKERVGFGVVCTKRGNMPAAALANGIALIRDDHVITSSLEIFNEVISSVLLDLGVIDNGESGGLSGLISNRCSRSPQAPQA